MQFDAITRRSLLALGGTAGAAVVLGTRPALAAARSEDIALVLEGRIATERPDWRYVPFEVPADVERLTVRLTYDRTGGSALDLGIFDTGGIALGREAGFRGWSGGSRSEFTISRADATPGYLPGEIEPGTWNIILGPYSVAPGGVSYRLDVTLGFADAGEAFVPSFAPAGPLTNRPGWYRGDFHVHTIYSDGGFTPAETVAGAVAAGLDFYASAEHNTPALHLALGEVSRDDLLILNGEEVTTRAGHMNVVGLRPGHWIDWRYRPEDGQLERFTDDVREDGGLAIANHPAATFKGGTWGFGYDAIDAIEVWNGQQPQSVNEGALAIWDGLLRRGRPVTLLGASDAHRSPNPIGRPQNAVRARRLSTHAVVEAVREGRCYAVRGPETTLELIAHGPRGMTAGLGDRLPSRPGDRVRVELRVLGAPGTVGTLHDQRGQRASHAIRSDSDRVITRTTARESRWIRGEVRNPDGTFVGLTNPVWLGPQSGR